MSNELIDLERLFSTHRRDAATLEILIPGPDEGQVKIVGTPMTIVALDIPTVTLLDEKSPTYPTGYVVRDGAIKEFEEALRNLVNRQNPHRKFYTELRPGWAVPVVSWLIATNDEE